MTVSLARAFEVFDVYEVKFQLSETHFLKTNRRLYNVVCLRIFK